MVRNPAQPTDFFTITDVKTGCGLHPASCSVGTAILSRGKNGRGVQLITHVHLVPKFRMTGALLQLPLCLIMAWVGADLHYSSGT